MIPEISGSCTMSKKLSASVEIRAMKPVQTKIQLKYMAMMLYFLMFVMLMFNTPFFMFLPLWLKREYDPKSERQELWNGIPISHMEMTLLIIGSLDFLQPLITPYIRNHIRLQCKICFIAGVIANFLFMCASAKSISALAHPLHFSILAAVFTGICNCVHLFEYFIREMTSDKKKQSEIIENLAICQIVGIIFVTAICSGTWDWGEQNSGQGFAFLNGMSLLFGIFGTVVLFYFFHCMPPKRFYPTTEESVFQNLLTGIPQQILVILGIRFFISFNFGLLRVVLSPYFEDQIMKQSAIKTHSTKILGAMFVIAIMISMSFLYFSRDTFHRNKWLWFPYIQMAVAFSAPIVLICLALVEVFWFQYVMGIIGGSLSFLMQAKLTIDRNLMSTDEILPKTSNLSLIVNGLATTIAVTVAPHLRQEIGVKTLLINAGNLFLVFVALLIYHYRTSLRRCLEPYRDIEVIFQNDFLKHLYLTWMTGGKISQVGKTRLLQEIKKNEPEIEIEATCT
jgi:hypothetical protein